jgi:nitrite reductase/ring-hydroxylating ferredoxin subunit
LFFYGNIDQESKLFCAAAKISALFRIEDGYCVSGPCTRQSLQRIAVTERDGWLVALEPPERIR